MPPKVDRARRGQFPAPPDMVVEEQPEPQQPARPQPVAIRQDEAQRMDDVRRDAPQDFALFQRLAHKAEFIMLQIAQPPVDQLGRGRSRTPGQIARLDQPDSRPPTSRPAPPPRPTHSPAEPSAPAKTA